MKAREHAERLYAWLERQELIKTGDGPKALALAGMAGVIAEAMQDKEKADDE